MVSGLSVITKKEYLVITIKGTYDYWECLHYPLKILKECQKRNRTKALVDLRALTTGEVTLIELFFLGEKIAHTLGNKIIMALVWKKDSHADFLADVATNRSARLKIFNTIKVAESWLLRSG